MPDEKPTMNLVVRCNRCFKQLRCTEGHFLDDGSVSLHVETCLCSVATIEEKIHKHLYREGTKAFEEALSKAVTHALVTYEPKSREGS